MSATIIHDGFTLTRRPGGGWLCPRSEVSDYYTLGPNVKIIDSTLLGSGHVLYDSVIIDTDVSGTNNLLQNVNLRACNIYQSYIINSDLVNTWVDNCNLNACYVTAGGIEHVQAVETIIHDTKVNKVRLHQALIEEPGDYYSLTGLPYDVVYQTKTDTLQIGCQKRSVEQWKSLPNYGVNIRGGSLIRRIVEPLIDAIRINK